MPIVSLVCVRALYALCVDASSFMVTLPHHQASQMASLMEGGVSAYETAEMQQPPFGQSG